MPKEEWIVGHRDLECVMQALYKANAVGVPFADSCDRLRKTGGVSEVTNPPKSRAMASPDCAFRINSYPDYTVVVRETYPSRPAPIDITTGFEYNLDNGAVMPKVALMKLPKIRRKVPMMMGYTEEEVINTEFCLQSRIVQLDALIQTASRRGVSADELGQCLLQPDMGFSLLRRSGSWYNAVDLQGRLKDCKKSVYLQVHMTQHDPRKTVEIGLLARPA